MAAKKITDNTDNTDNTDDTDSPLMALARQLKTFNKFQGKPDSFTISANCIKVLGKVVPVTVEYLALLGLYTVVQYDNDTISNMLAESWVDLMAVRHNHLLCIVGGNKLIAELKSSKDVVKTSVTFDTDDNSVTFKLTGKGDINNINIILASHLYGLATYNKQFKAYSSNLT